MRIRAFAALVMLLVGCAGGARGKYTRKNVVRLTLEQNRDKLTKELLGYIERKDDRGIAHMLSSPMGYGGVWFPDTTCRRKFSGAGTIPEAGLDAFALCLVNLPLQVSTRKHPYPDVTVFTYEPGLEIEALFDPEEGGHLIWIGYVSRRDIKDALPTVAPDALLAMRNEVAPLVIDEPTRRQIDVELAAAAEPKPVTAFAWFKVCIDATGAVSGVHARVSNSITAQDAFAAWVRQWTFRSFKLGEQPSPVCSLVRIADPPAETETAAMPWPVPPEYADNLILTGAALGERLAGEPAVTPDEQTLATLRAAGGGQIMSLALYCVDETGQVDDVVLMRATTFDAYNKQLVEGIKGWRFAPVVRAGTPVRACSHMSFLFTQLPPAAK